MRAPVEEGPMADSELVQEAFTSILRHNMEDGVAPHFTALAAEFDVSPDEGLELQQAATQASVGCWISHETDYIHSFAPFSNLPTQYRVSVDGEQKW